MTGTKQVQFTNRVDKYWTAELRTTMLLNTSKQKTVKRRKVKNKENGTV